MTPNDISKRFPQFQFSIREAQEILKTPLVERTDADIERLNARAQQGIQGRNLYFVLTQIMGIPLATKTLTRNYYTVDGYWFSLKTESDANDERQPVYVSSSGAQKSQQAITFTLYAGKVAADPDYSHWPSKRVLVGRNVHLHNAVYTRLRAELADLLDELDAAYEAELPRYQAWKAIQMTPAEQQNFFLQLIRRALRTMPAREIQPVALAAADAADAQAAIDGMLPMNYDPFDEDDESDDLDDTDLDEDYPDEEEADGLYDDDDGPTFDGPDDDDEDGDEDFEDEDEGETPSPDVNRHDEKPELIPA